jgi:anti-sigma factor RsiW
MTDRDRPTTEDNETHPVRLLAGYVSGELTPGEASLVDRHLSSCETCREEAHLAAPRPGPGVPARRQPRPPRR